MKLILKYLRQYTSEYVHGKLYISTAIFLTICIALNYHYDFRNRVIYSYDQPIKLLYFLMFQAIPHYVTCLLVYCFTPVKKFVTQRGFWFTSIVGFTFLAVHRASYFPELALPFLPNELYTFAYKCIRNFGTFLWMVAPLYLYYRVIDKQLGSFYGITRKGVNLKPYFILLLLVVPLVTGASFFQDFLNTYPMYQRANGVMAAQYLNLPEWAVVGIYETAYASSFFSVELFFRGFLIFGLMRYLGPYVVLPMVATYAFLHFGKPLGETIGSIFGGYILGIVAYYSRNIWGGVFVHIGLALLMDLAAFLQR